MNKYNIILHWDALKTNIIVNTYPWNKIEHKIIVDAMPWNIIETNVTIEVLPLRLWTSVQNKMILKQNSTLENLLKMIKANPNEMALSNKIGKGVTRISYEKIRDNILLLSGVQRLHLAKTVHNLNNKMIMNSNYVKAQKKSFIKWENDLILNQSSIENVRKTVFESTQNEAVSYSFVEHILSLIKYMTTEEEMLLRSIVSPSLKTYVREYKTNMFILKSSSPNVNMTRYRRLGEMDNFTLQNFDDITLENIDYIVL